MRRIDLAQNNHICGVTNMFIYKHCDVKRHFQVKTYIFTFPEVSNLYLQTLGGDQ